MTQKEILQNNRMIAEFMGFTINNGRFEKIREYEDEYFSKHIGGVSIKEVFYNTSWNWLMPVVEKIEAMGYKFKIYNNWASIFEQNGEQIKEWNGDTKLSATYQAVCEFIKQVKG